MCWPQVPTPRWGSIVSGEPGFPMLSSGPQSASSLARCFVGPEEHEALGVRLAVSRISGTESDQLESWAAPVHGSGERGPKALWMGPRPLPPLNF